MMVGTQFNIDAIAVRAAKKVQIGTRKKINMSFCIVECFACALLQLKSCLQIFQLIILLLW